MAPAGCMNLALLRRPGAWLLICLVLTLSCSFHPERRRTVVEGDFMEPLPPEERSELEERIRALRDEIQLDFENAELHRSLAVLYRMQGTPHSRLLSSEEIERAIALDPGNAIYRVEKGLTLAARRFVGDAEDAFLEATRLDPRCAEAWFQLGRLEQREYCKTMCFPDHLIKAIEYFKNAHRYNRKHEETLLNLGFLHSFRQMHETGLQYASRAATYHPKSARPHLLCGMLHTRCKQFDKAETSFAAAFQLMKEHERNRYENIAELLPPDERELYLSSMPAKRADWNRRFWAENDPTPSSEINERRLEHYTRLVIADWTLSDERLGLVGSETHRGATLIRFGLPDHRYYDLGSGTSGAWVVWRYDQPGGSFMMYFHDEFLSGDFHFPIFDYYGERSRRLLETVPQRYTYPVAFASFPVSVAIADFRGSDDRTKIQLAVAIPDSLLGSKSERWNLLITFFDAEWNRFFRNRFSLRPDSLPRIEKLGSTYLAFHVDIEMLPRALDCACVVEVVLDKDLKKGSRRLPLAIRDLHGRSLKLSSVRFALPGVSGCSDALDPIPSYSRRERLCLGYEVYNLKLDEERACRYRVTYAIRKPDPDSDGSPASLQKTLSYVWATITGGGKGETSYIESSFEQRAGASTVADNLQIDLATLDPGAYLLVLFVQDLATGASAAESKLFTVTE